MIHLVVVHPATVQVVAHTVAHATAVRTVARVIAAQVAVTKYSFAYQRIVCYTMRLLTQTNGAQYGLKRN